MREIRLVAADTPRPALVLTRSTAREYMRRVTVAPITSTIRGLTSEVEVGPENGLDHRSVVSIDNTMTVGVEAIGRLVGYLLPHQEEALARAVVLAFDLAAALEDDSLP
ncbi:MAG: type II toxin-antitoxin system PemK/MazF family toxin [bacterium]|nr:type II toxin-antitoxin system PemK/MazF family toxin [bacterium]